MAGRAPRHKSNLAEIQRKNREDLKARNAKLATRQPLWKRQSTKPCPPPPTQAKPKQPMLSRRVRTSIVETPKKSDMGRRPRTTATATVRQPPIREQECEDQAVRIAALEEEVRHLKELLAQRDTIHQPVQAEQQPRSDPIFEHTRGLLQKAYESLSRCDQILPSLTQANNVKKAAKILIGIAAGYFPGSPYHSLYLRAMGEFRGDVPLPGESRPEQIIVRPGDIDPMVTTIINLSRGVGDVSQRPTTPQSGGGHDRIMSTRGSPYSPHIRTLETDFVPRQFSPLRDFEAEYEAEQLIQPAKYRTTPEEEKKRAAKIKARREKELRKIGKRRREMAAGQFDPYGAYERIMDAYGRIGAAERLAECRPHNLSISGTDDEDSLDIYRDPYRPADVSLGSYGGELVENVVSPAQQKRAHGFVGDHGPELCFPCYPMCSPADSLVK